MKKIYLLLVLTLVTIIKSNYVNAAAAAASGSSSEVDHDDKESKYIPAVRARGIVSPEGFFTNEELSEGAKFAKAIRSMKKHISDAREKHSDLALIIGRGSKHPLPASMYEDGRFWVYNEVLGYENDRKNLEDRPVWPLSLETYRGRLPMPKIKYNHIMFDWSTIKFFSKNGIDEILDQFLLPGGSFVFDETNLGAEVAKHPFDIKAVLDGSKDWVYISHFGNDFEIKQSVYEAGKLVEGEEVGDNNILMFLKPRYDAWMPVRMSFPAIDIYEKAKGEYPDSAKAMKTLIDLAVKHEVAPKFKSCKWTEGAYPFKGADPEFNGYYLCEGFKE